MSFRRSQIVTVILFLLPVTTSAFSPRRHSPRSSCVLHSKADQAAQDALERTASHLKKMTRTVGPLENQNTSDLQRDELYQTYILQPASSLKEQLKARRLPQKGRKPDLAARLVENDLRKIDKQYSEYNDLVGSKPSMADTSDVIVDPKRTVGAEPVDSFAGTRLSRTAGKALAQAGFDTPTSVQEKVIPRLAAGESLIIHAETGSGKTLAYLLPFTERLWAPTPTERFCVILTPTRELAAQVAGVASVLAPPDSVRFVSRATNLMSDGMKDRGERPAGGRYEDRSDGGPRLFIGSAKAIMQSLYGDERMPAPPTPKPLAMDFLRNTDCVVMDEVDRLLRVKTSRGDKQYQSQHEKPAAVVCAAVARLTLGRVQVVAASATVGRPLRREVARVLGLPYSECPITVRATSDDEINTKESTESSVHVGRAVTIPDTVENFVLPVQDNPSPGRLLTEVYGIITTLAKSNYKMLLVLSRGFGINTQNVIGALKHFSCDPEPQSLLDALEGDGTEELIRVHREVSGATGVGESLDSEKTDGVESKNGYLLVTGEDTVRGLHLDGLDAVIVAGRCNGPDEYTHVAGRTGRGGRKGRVINVLGEKDAATLKSWERMLDIAFGSLTRQELSNL